MPISPDEWRSLGAITFPKGNPVFPEDPENQDKHVKVPGVYRLTLNNGYIYIGQSKRLRERFGDYRAPTSGTEQEHILRHILMDARGAKVEVFTGSEMSDCKKRLKLEAEEKAAAIRAGLPLLNDGGLGHGHYLKFKVKYHEDLLCDSIGELRKWNLNLDPPLSDREGIIRVATICARGPE